MSGLSGDGDKLAGIGISLSPWILIPLLALELAAPVIAGLFIHYPANADSLASASWGVLLLVIEIIISIWFGIALGNLIEPLPVLLWFKWRRINYHSVHFMGKPHYLLRCPSRVDSDLWLGVNVYRSARYYFSPHAFKKLSDGFILGSNLPLSLSYALTIISIFLFTLLYRAAPVHYILVSLLSSLIYLAIKINKKTRSRFDTAPT